MFHSAKKVLLCMKIYKNHTKKYLTEYYHACFEWIGENFSQK